MLPTDIATVCCADDGGWMLFIGLPGASQAPIAFNAQPSSPVRLPDSLLALNKRIETQWMAAVLSGNSEEERHLGYSLLKHPPTRKLQLALRDAVRRQEPLLYDVLANSSLAAHRAAAAEAIGYATPSTGRLQALAAAALDPDSEVRNNAVRALILILEADPAQIPQFSFEPLIPLLSSPNWSDRNKSAALFEVLTRTLRPEILHSLRAFRTHSALVEMAAWHNPGHAFSSRLILERLSATPPASHILPP